MPEIIEALSNVVAAAAEFGANMPSAWFTYQPEVPECLKEAE